MDPVFGIMLDVVRIVTFQPNVTNTETRRFAPERELKTTDAMPADEWAPDAAHATKRDPVRLRSWFRFAFVSR
jgi:hypothetical protein